MSSEKVSCTRRLDFDAAHRVLNHGGKCKALHGHKYFAEITCSSMSLDTLGFVIDFSKIKELVGAYINENWDHNIILNREDPLLELGKLMPSVWADKKPFVLDGNPTAENLAIHLYNKSNELLAEHLIECTHVRVFETQNCWADYPASK